MGDSKETAKDTMSPSQKEFQKLMGENLNGTDISQGKFLSYQSKAPAAPSGKKIINFSRSKSL